MESFRKKIVLGFVFLFLVVSCNDKSSSGNENKDSAPVPTVQETQQPVEVPTDEPVEVPTDEDDATIGGIITYEDGECYEDGETCNNNNDFYDNSGEDEQDLGGAGDVVFHKYEEKIVKVIDIFPLDHINNNGLGVGGFIALKNDGTVVMWGHSDYVGVSNVVKDNLVGVKSIFSTGCAVAALKEDGTVVTWGNPGCGGNSRSVKDNLVGVKSIFSTESAFAALKEDGTVVTWGDRYYGSNSSGVKDNLVGVKSIFSTERAFAALKEDGTVVTWGDSDYGGNSSSVEDQLLPKVIRVDKGIETQIHFDEQ